MSKRESSFALLTGILVGAAVGAAAGILFAPASGKETRERLRREADTMSKDLELKAQRLSKDLEREALKFKKQSIDPVARDLQSRLPAEAKKAVKKVTNSKPATKAKKAVKATRRVVRR